MEEVVDISGGGTKQGEGGTHGTLVTHGGLLTHGALGEHVDPCWHIYEAMAAPMGPFSQVEDLRNCIIVTQMGPLWHTYLRGHITVAQSHRRSMLI